MNKKLIIGIALVVVAILVVLVVTSGKPSLTGKNDEATPSGVPDPRNASYTIEGETFELSKGEVTVQVDAGVFVKYKYFQQADGLLNEDETTDSGVMIVADAGGSGTFYYAAALVSTPSGWKGTNVILLGDRIAPQLIDVADDMVVVNYAIRKPGEPFTVQPSVGVTRYFQVRNGTLVEVDKDKKAL